MGDHGVGVGVVDEHVGEYFEDDTAERFRGGFVVEGGAERAEGVGTEVEAGEESFALVVFEEGTEEVPDGEFVFVGPLEEFPDGVHLFEI